MVPCVHSFISTRIYNKRRLRMYSSSSRFGFCLTALVYLSSLANWSEAKKSKVISLTSATWKDTLEGEWVIKFYAPWCPACKSIEEDYKKFAEWSDDLNINVAEVDINKEPGLSGRFIVTSLPSIYHAKNGDFHRYTGVRDTNSLHKYVEDKIWKTTEPVSWYRHPNSIPMSLMAGLFQTSVIMNNFHETLTETYGFSTNMSYVIFAIVTIITGLILGLIMVFIIDCIAPPKPKDRRTPLPATGEVDEAKIDNKNKSDENEAMEVDDDEASTGRDSATASEKEEDEDVKKNGSQGDSSEGDEGRRSQASSQSSSRTSQEWEQVQGSEADEIETELTVEKALPDEQEEGQGELRRRVTTKPSDEEHKDD